MTSSDKALEMGMKVERGRRSSSLKGGKEDSNIVGPKEGLTRAARATSCTVTLLRNMICSKKVDM